MAKLIRDLPANMNKSRYLDVLVSQLDDIIDLINIHKGILNKPTSEELARFDMTSNCLELAKHNIEELNK